MAYDIDQLTAIDQRIRAAQATDRAVATVVSAQSDALRAMVTFDGSSLAVPVRLGGNVNAVAGDRVGLLKWGADWIIVTQFALRWPGALVINQAATTGTTSSGTYSALPGTPTGAVTKRWDSTDLRIDLASSCDVDTNLTKADFGVDVDGTTYTIRKRLFGTAGVRGDMTGILAIPALPAGDYTVTVVWRRDAGAGTVRQFVGDDWVSLGVTETA